MHADLIKLLDLQAKDAVLHDAEQRLTALDRNAAALDQALQRARETLDAAQRALADGRRRRDELEAKIESYRLLQDRRKQRLDQVKTSKEASAVMAELDLARSVMAKEEGDWVRTADGVVQLEIRVQAEESNLKTIESSQAEERALLGQRRAALEVERAAALREREFECCHHRPAAPDPLRPPAPEPVHRCCGAAGGRRLRGLSYRGDAESAKPDQGGFGHRRM